MNGGVLAPGGAVVAGKVAVFIRCVPAGWVERCSVGTPVFGVVVKAIGVDVNACPLRDVVSFTFDF